MHKNFYYTLLAEFFGWEQLLWKQATLILAFFGQEYILLHANTEDLNLLINIDVYLWKFIVYTVHV